MTRPLTRHALVVGCGIAGMCTALAAAARYNLHVMRGMLRTVNLLEKPGAFLEDRRTRMIVFLYMLRGRRRNAQARHQRGPSRAQMLEMVGQVRAPS